MTETPSVTFTTPGGTYLVVRFVIADGATTVSFCVSYQTGDLWPKRTWTVLSASWSHL